MKINSPLPKPLPKECLKAAQILSSFVDRSNNGLDGVIPRQVLSNAKGFAIFTIVKAGFLFSARAGSGVVIAKLDNGSWSAPSAIGTAGLGVGGQIGAEVTDFLVVLNSRSAVKTFMSAGSLTLGGNMSVALGPLGRNGEASGSLNTSGKVSAMYSYSKTRGLFGGVSLEGSVIVERQDANATAYHSDVSASQLLSGQIDPPDWVSPLIKSLEACTGMPGGRQWVEGESGSGRGVGRGLDDEYAFGGIGSPGSESAPSLLKRKSKGMNSHFSPHTWGGRKSSVSGSGSYFPASDQATDLLEPDPISNHFKTDTSIPTTYDNSGTRNFETQFESDFNLIDTSTPNSPPHRLHNKPGLTSPINPIRTPTIVPSSTFPSSPFASSSSPRGPFDTNHARSRSFSQPIKGPSNVPSDRFGITPRDPMPSLLDDFDEFSVRDNTGGRAATPATGSKPRLTPKPGLEAPLRPGEVGRAIALYDFGAVQPGDLAFKKGQVITITQKSTRQDDWWTGKVDGRNGVFPANFVEVV